MNGTALTTAGLICCLAVPATAQVTGHLDLGLGSASMPGLGMTTLRAAAPSLRLETRNFRAEGSGDFRDLGPAGRELSGVAAASYFVRLPGPLLLELNGGGATREAAGTAASTWNGGVRMHLRTTNTGGWLGFRGGQDRLGELQGWEAGLWRDLGRISLQLQGRQTTGGVELTAQPLGSRDSLSRSDTTAQSRVRLTTEVGGWLSWTSGRLQLRTGAGWRISNREPVRSGALADIGLSGSRQSDGWWTAEGTLWLSERLGLTGSVGKLAPNPSLLLSPTNFMRLSVRIGLDRHLTNSAAPARRPAGLRALRRGGQVELQLDAPIAIRVEVMGDLTDWLPVDMNHQAGNRWAVRLAATPGIHYLNVRYDGGAWQTPPSLRMVQDEFGKETGLLLVQ